MHSARSVHLFDDDVCQWGVASWFHRPRVGEPASDWSLQAGRKQQVSELVLAKGV